MRDAVMYPPVTWQSVPVLAGLHHQYSGYDFRKGQQVNLHSLLSAISKPCRDAVDGELNAAQDLVISFVGAMLLQ